VTKRAPEYDQPDLFGEFDAKEARAERIRARLATLRLDCCTGAIPDLGWVQDNDRGEGHSFPQQRCGRCGQLDAVGSLMVNHALGWCGCPADRDRHAAEGHRGVFGRHLTVEEMCDRHDRVHYADCVCGHPRGLHTGSVLPEEARCDLCRCVGWKAVVSEDGAS
jgi:hypothetical protein